MTLAEIVYSIKDGIVGNDQEAERGPPERGRSVQTQTLHLEHLLLRRQDAKVLADRLRTSRFRLWSHGVDVGVADLGNDEVAVETATGLVLTLRRVGPDGRSRRVVPPPNLRRHH